MSMLMLDEPTENLGSEDGSIERLADAISQFKAIEQIVAVTHSEAFAAKADHVVILKKRQESAKSLSSAEKLDSCIPYSPLFEGKIRYLEKDNQAGPSPLPLCMIIQSKTSTMPESLFSLISAWKSL